MHSVDFCLMNSLVKNGIYTTQDVKDNICSCDKSDVISYKASSGQKNYSTLRLFTLFSFMQSLTMGWTVVMSFSIGVITNIGALVSTFGSVFFFSAVSTGLPEFETSSKILCQLETTKYIYTDHVQNVDTTTNCSSYCSVDCDPGRPFRAHRIGQTNLLFVSAQGINEISIRSYFKKVFLIKRVMNNVNTFYRSW